LRSASALATLRAAVAFAILAAHPATAEPQVVSFPGAEGATLRGWLYLPATPGPHRAIVALHGCSGLLGPNGLPSARHDDWGARWSAAGFVALFPDSFGSRGLGPQCKNEDRKVHPSRERVDDANAALHFLIGRSDIDAKQVALVGWSNGGSSTLYAVQHRNNPALANGGEDFARAIAFYPGCRTPLETGRWRTRIPLLILIGADDDWTPAAPCADLAAGAKANGEPVEIVTYPGAYHDFDHPNLPVHTVEGLAFTGGGSGVAHTGTNPAARADAIERAMDFLRQ
jgi:dienelactone hydrolase